MKKHLLALVVGTISTLSWNASAVTKSRFEELELFNKVLYLIESQYYREVDTNKLIEGALKGMMDTLDPHSAFLSKEFFSKMQSDTDGEFGGLGIEVTQKDGVIYVVTPIEDTPAHRSGIRPRDKIVEINHESILGMTLDEAIDRMKGEKGTKIHLGIVREGERGIKHFEMVRESIKIKPIKFELLADNYGWIRLTQFQRNSTTATVEAMKALSKQAEKNGGIRGYIFDLRSNPGGLLDQAVDISSLFLKEGVVVSTEARDPNNKEIRYVKKTGHKDLTTPLIVLVNGASASASEIVAGALQDHKRALILGSQTFGKGSVQTVAKIDKDNGVKLTVAQYMTPNNRKIQAIGIKPDIELDEFDAKWVNDHKNESNFIREKDLRNHLTATIETAEEKKMREEEEKKMRAKRAELIKSKASKVDEKGKAQAPAVEAKEDPFKQYDPKEDYQIVQAVNLLKTFKIYESFQTPVKQ
jgi:carboxyl-terminal processing protease